MTDSFLQRGLRVLECLDDAKSLSELAKKLNLPKSTVFRILEHLRSEGWVVQQHDNSYAPGWRWRSARGEIASTKQIDQDLHNEFARFRDITGWSINYLSFSGDALRRMSHLSGSDSTRGSSQIGEVMPLSTSPSGLAVLGSLPESRSIRLLESEYSAATSHHHAHFQLSLPELTTALRRVRSRGFSYSQRSVGEPQAEHLSLHCIAVQVGDTGINPPIGVVCASRASSRMNPRELKDITRTLTDIKRSTNEIYAL